MKNIKVIVASAISAALLMPSLSQADMILDTGTPAGSSTYILSTAQFLAAEFSATANQTVTGLSAYLTQGSGTIGDHFVFDIYANSGFTNRPSSRPAPVFTTTGTYTGNGWNTTSVNWTPNSSGYYWLALQVSSTTQTRGLSLPGEASSTTGTVPALAFAYAGTNGQYSLSGAPAVGLQVNAVPLPAAAWLLGSGLLGIGATLRRKKEANGIA